MAKFQAILILIGVIAVGSSVGCSEEQKAISVETVFEEAKVPTVDSTLGICSNLDFSSVSWPLSLPFEGKRALALALNITGSYEGRAGWTNLANNFDGQGVSLGLNQQNLGQGTLQPMLKKMLDGSPAIIKALMSTANHSSMTQMVTAWAKATPIIIAGLPLFPDRLALSPLDEGFEEVMIVNDSRNTDSITWALNTVFEKNKKDFKSEWSQSLRSIAATAEYRSLQVDAAMQMFSRAIGYFQSFGFSELRSLLLMYDFVVQNGGFNSGHVAQFQGFEISNPGASETARLLKLLEIRLVSVRAQFRNDVDSRKKTIINGIGRVHGAARNLPTEFCYTSHEPMRSLP